jgi:hypothetical protein
MGWARGDISVRVVTAVLVGAVLLGPAAPARATVIAKSGENQSISGVLHVESIPTRADVYVSVIREERGEYIGKTPVEKWLLPRAFWVTVEYPGRVPVHRKLIIRSQDINRLVVQLDYEMNPYKRYGHLAFWPGAAFTLLGVAAVTPMVVTTSRYDSDGQERDRTTGRIWTGVMGAAFGAGAVLMTTGVVLWILSPGDKAYFDEKYGVPGLSALDRSGVLFSYSRTF